MKYRCVKTCFFNGRFYKRGETPSFDVPVNEHFVEIDGEVALEKEDKKEEPKTLLELQKLDEEQDPLLAKLLS